RPDDRGQPVAQDQRPHGPDHAPLRALRPRAGGGRMNIAALVADWAARTPDAVALIDTHRRRTRRTTFRQLDDAGARGAMLLWRKGLRPGDAVLVFQPMSRELYVALQALYR